jgi:hypothetical protein
LFSKTQQFDSSTGFPEDFGVSGIHQETIIGHQEYDLLNNTYSLVPAQAK